MDRPICVVKTNSSLGESPVWSDEEKVLYWIDILKGYIHRFDPKTKQNSTIELSQLISSIGLHKNNKLIVTLRKQIALFDLQTKTLQEIGSVELDRLDNRLNDGKVDREGNLWCTSLNQKNIESATATLHRVGQDHTIQLMEDQVILGNGMAWSPDNRTFYFTQTRRFTIFAYDFDPRTGNISSKRIFAQMDPVPIGGPDGLTVDRDGFVWSAQYGSGCIHRFSPDGKLERTIHLPVKRVSSCTFGGENFKTIFITTAQENATPEELAKYPLSGSLFALETDIQGIKEPFYLG